MLYGFQVFYSYFLMLVAMTYQVYRDFNGIDSRDMSLLLLGLVRRWVSISFTMTE